jgi:hypothetical protein
LPPFPVRPTYAHRIVPLYSASQVPIIAAMKIWFRSGAEKGGEQPREKSWSAYTETPQSQAPQLAGSGYFCGKLNRQTREVETTPSARKQRTVTSSNRQNIKFRTPRNPSAGSSKETPVSNRELLVLETPQLAENTHRHPVLIENFEPTYSAKQAGQS